MAELKRKYAWRPDLPDKRDRLYSSFWRPKRVLPASVDLRGHASAVENQADAGSCTGNSTVSVLEYLEIKSGIPFVDLSRLFVYYNARALEGSTNEDAGAMLRDCIKTLVADNVCPESLWPYDTSKVCDKPTEDAYNAALNHQVLEYHRIKSLDEMMGCIADGFPFVFGFTVYESFESEEVAKTGLVPMPGAHEKSLGGHAVAAFGYDRDKALFTVRNSWGVEWGDKGYFYMPFAYIGDSDLSDDMWTVRRTE